MVQPAPGHPAPAQAGPPHLAPVPLLESTRSERPSDNWQASVLCELSCEPPPDRQTSHGGNLSSRGRELLCSLDEKLPKSLPLFWVGFDHLLQALQIGSCRSLDCQLALAAAFGSQGDRWVVDEAVVAWAQANGEGREQGRAA